MRLTTAILCLLGLGMTVPPARGDDAGFEFFEKKIRPLLVTHCYECHAADSKKIGGSLLLDGREGWRKGGDSGPAIEAGQPWDPLESTCRHASLSIL